MIFLNHFELESKLEICNEKINVLVVENNTKFFDYCKELVLQQEGEVGGFILFDERKEYSISKFVKIVFDFFNLDLNDKKMQTSLFTSLSSICQNEMLVEASSLLTNIATFVDKLNTYSDFELDFNEQTPISAIFKAFGVSAKNDSTNLLSALVNYMQFCSKLLGIKLFVFVNLKTFISEKDLQTFYKQIMLDDLNVLLLENTLRPKIDGEYITLIDNDLCEIIV